MSFHTQPSLAPSGSQIPPPPSLPQSLSSTLPVNLAPPSALPSSHTPLSSEDEQRRAEILSQALSNHVTHDLNICTNAIPRTEFSCTISGIRVIGEINEARFEIETAIFNTFKEVGVITNITPPLPMEHAGPWVVEFQHVHETLNAVRKFNKTTLPNGNLITVTHSSDPQSRKELLEKAAARVYASFSTATFLHLPFLAQPTNTLADFFGSFGPIESYVLVPYNLHETVAFVKYQNPSSVRNAVELCAQKDLTVHGTAIKCYPGIYKPFSLLHRLDLCPLVKQVYNRATNPDLIEFSYFGPNTTSTSPESDYLHMKLSTIGLEGALLPYNIVFPYAAPALTAPVAPEKPFFGLMISNLFPISPLPPQEEINDILLDVLQELSKYGTISFHALQTKNASLHVVFDNNDKGLSMTKDTFDAVVGLFCGASFDGRSLSCIAMSKEIMKKTTTYRED